MEELLEQTIRTGLKMKVITAGQPERVNVDTTVEEKHVRFPTGSRLYDRARERLVKEARRGGHCSASDLLPHRQTPADAAEPACPCAAVQTRGPLPKKLHPLLGRVIRDIERKAGGAPGPALEEILKRARRIHAQQRHDKNKLYSVHAPEVECISKGKVHRRYEFGVKVSVATTSKGGWHAGAMNCPGNPCDGHTLAPALEQVERLTGRKPARVFADGGCRGRGCAQG